MNNINYLLIYKVIIIGGSLTLRATMNDKVPTAKKRFDGTGMADEVILSKPN